LRSNPIDGAVLLGGRDKTTSALITAAISMDLPFIYVPAGFVLHGLWRGEHLGSGVDGWKYGPELRQGLITDCDWSEIEAGSVRAGSPSAFGWHRGNVKASKKRRQGKVGSS
jgi:dihydroxyacid dehydratase/phosphogluconate dehydratase